MADDIAPAALKSTKQAESPIRSTAMTPLLFPAMLQRSKTNEFF
jgi:hypothetical protein